MYNIFEKNVLKPFSSSSIQQRMLALAYLVVLDSSVLSPVGGIVPEAILYYLVDRRRVEENVEY